MRQIDFPINVRLKWFSRYLWGKRPLKLLLLLLITGLTEISYSKNSDPVTYFENSGYKKTPKYVETLEFSKKLDELNPWAGLVVYGTSPQGRDLFCLVADKDGLVSPEEIHQAGRTVLMVEACIHAGEPDGKDAGLLLLRDMMHDKAKRKLLDTVTLVFIPIMNVDGHERFGRYNRINQNGPAEMGWRTNAQNLNLNRDFLKAEAPEMKALLKLYHKWNPDFFIDCHVTDGADYIYPLTYFLEINGSMDEGLTQWQKESYLPWMTNAMEKSGYPIFRYVDFRQWSDIESGLANWATSPALSTGYTAATNRPGLLIETHMLKDYKTRVFATYYMLLHTMEYLFEHGTQLKKLNLEADMKCSSQDFRKSPLALDFEMTGDSTPVLFRGMEYTFNKSEITGSDYISYKTVPKDYQLKFFGELKQTEKTYLPVAYIVPGEYGFIEELLIFHNIKYKKLLQNADLTVSSYKFRDVKFNPRPYEGRQMVSSFQKDSVSYQRTFYRDSIIVPTDQPLARLIAHIFEPGSPASLLQFGHFNAIFEQKEYGESYVLEKMAAEMMANDLKIKREFEQALKENPDMEKDFYDKLNWFYFHSPYADPWLNVYPIGKILDQETYKKISR